MNQLENCCKLINFVDLKFFIQKMKSIDRIIRNEFEHSKTMIFTLVIINAYDN